MGIASVINKAEIQLYSTLISVMSGINQLKDPEPQIAKTVDHDIPPVEVLPAVTFSDVSELPVTSRWQTIQQTLLSLVLWIILGFMAGFLIGMISAG